MSRDRRRLPNRRPSLTSTATWPLGSDNAVHVSISVDSAGAVREVFARSAKSNSAVDLAADDAAVLLSLLLQNDVPLSAICHSMGRTSSHEPASIVALVADLALRVEAELRGPVLVEGAAP